MHIERIIPDDLINKNYWLSRENTLLENKLYFNSKEICSNSEMLNCHIKRYLFAFEQISEGLILDAGCGVGYGSEILSRRGNVIAVDNAEEAIVYARHRYGRFNISFVQDNILKMDFPEIKAVCAFEIIEHLSAGDGEALVEKFLDALEPGGKLIVSTPIADDGTNPFHLHTYSIKELEALLSGFEIKERLYQNIDGAINETYSNYIYIIVAIKK